MIRIFEKSLYILVLCSVFMFVSSALATEEFSGTEIMDMMRQRDDGEDRQGIMTMTLINKRGSQRVRVLDQISKDYGMDRKSLITFNKPADVKGTKFLSWTYDESGKDDDKWLYIPALKKVRRISGAANNDFFMGSDFTYDDIDMGRRNLSKDVHTFVLEEKYGDFDCWKVESIPVDKGDPVLRRMTWIDKKTHLVVHSEYYEKKGLTRVYDVLKIQEQQGFWAVQEAKMKNLDNGHSTHISFSPFVYDQGMKDAPFQVANMQRGSR